jgi:hypothetical protein
MHSLKSEFVVDGDVDLRTFPWYHGPLSSSEAHDLLAPLADGAFLVRMSSKQGFYCCCCCLFLLCLKQFVNDCVACVDGCYVVSYKTSKAGAKGRILHVLLTVNSIYAATHTISQHACDRNLNLVGCRKVCRDRFAR